MMTTPDHTPLLTASDVSQWLATSEAALAQLRYRHEGPAYVHLGRSIRYRAVDVEAYIGENLVGIGH